MVSVGGERGTATNQRGGSGTDLCMCMACSHWGWRPLAVRHLTHSVSTPPPLPPPPPTPAAALRPRCRRNWSDQRSGRCGRRAGHGAAEQRRRNEQQGAWHGASRGGGGRLWGRSGKAWQRTQAPCYPTRACLRTTHHTHTYCAHAQQFPVRLHGRSWLCAFPTPPPPATTTHPPSPPRPPRPPGLRTRQGVMGDWRILAAYPLLLFIDFLLSIPAVSGALFNNLRRGPDLT